MESSFESTSRYADIKGWRLHYHDVGQGPVLLCIHGGAPGAFGWGNFGRNVAELQAKFRLIIVDLPGYGRSEKPATQDNPHALYAAMMASLFKIVGAERGHVLGMATGGAVAMRMAIDHPQSVDRLALVSTAGSRSMFGMKPPRGAGQQYLDGEGPTREKMRSYLAQLLYDQSLLTDELVEERYQASVKSYARPTQDRGDGDHGSPSRDLWKKADQIACETLIVWGRENRAHSFESAVLLHSLIKNSQLHVFGNCGLWVPYEKLFEFNRLLVNFLLANGDPPTTST